MNSSDCLESPRVLIDEIISLLSEHSTLIETHANEFFIDALLEKVPEELRHEIELLSDEQLIPLAAADGSHLPTECAALRHLCDRIAAASAVHNRHAIVPACFSDSSEVPCFSELGMSDKKRHEVTSLLHLAGSMHQNLNFDSVLDVGTGKGYLGVSLAEALQLPVCGVDSDPKRCQAAERRTKSAKAECTFSTVAAPFGTFTTHDDLTGRVLITALHACGELSPSVLRFFLDNPACQGLLLTGCCYNLLDSFPLSETVGRKTSGSLSRTARMLACQSPLRRQLPAESLFFRAVLQTLAHAKQTPVTKRLKGLHSHCLEDYIAEASRRLNVGFDLEAIQPWKDKQAVFYRLLQLRNAFAPLIETLVQMDWLCFLRERGVRAQLIQVFDPVVSPRCFVIAAWKARDLKEIVK